MGRKYSKIIIANLIGFLLIAFGMCNVGGTGKEVMAANGTNTYIGSEVADYKAGKKDTAYPQKEGMVFAGWYTDSGYTQALSGTPKTNVTYYAKFVPEEMLSLKFQFSSDKSMLRFITSVDNLNYQSYGFKIVVTDAGTVKEYMNTNTEVTKRIDATSDTDTYNYSPKVIDTASEYMITATWSGVTDTASYMVKPYWITLDGTTVYGVSRTVSKADYGKVNVTVKTADKVAVNTNLTATYGTSTQKGAKVVGYDAPYVHITIDATASSLSSVTAFTLKTTSGANVGTATYRNLATKYNGNNADTSWYTECKGETEFVIASSADLYGLSKLVYNGTNTTESFQNKTVYLVSDITVNEGEAKATLWIPTDKSATVYKWYPIGRKFSLDADANEFPFRGTFDGQDHTISGIYMDYTGTEGTGYTSASIYGGLFGCAFDGVIKNFRLINSCFISNYRCVGSVCGGGDGTFEKIYSDANVYSNSTVVGGMIGRVTDGAADDTDTVMKNCWYAGTITTTTKFQNASIGGLIGYLVHGYEADANVWGNFIQDCFYTGTLKYAGVTGNSNVRIGGLIGVSNGGSNSEVKISNTLCAGRIVNTSGNSNVTQAGTVIGKGGSTATVVLDNVYVTTQSTYAMKPVGDVASITVKGSSELSVQALNQSGSAAWKTVDGQVQLSAFADIKIKLSTPASQIGTVSRVAKIEVPTIAVPNTVADADGNYYSATHTGMQGGCFDGRYYYQSFLKYCYNHNGNYSGSHNVNNAKNIVVIVKYDVLSQQVVKISEPMALNHANDMTYNPKLDCLVVCHGSAPSTKTLAYVDAQTLELKKTFKLSYNVYGIDYNEAADQYIIATSNVSFVVADGNFTSFSKVYYGSSAAKAYTSQGVCCDENYIYWVYYGNGTNKITGEKEFNQDAIFVYDWDGNFVSFIEVDFGDEETENISVVDGNLYVGTLGILYKINGVVI